MTVLSALEVVVDADVRQGNLIARVGGHAWIARVVSDFYARLAEDPEIAWALKGVDVPALERRQVAFFVEALGGTAVPSPDDEVLDLSPCLFARAISHLAQALVARDMPASLLDEVVAAIVARAMR